MDYEAAIETIAEEMYSLPAGDLFSAVISS